MSAVKDLNVPAHRERIPIDIPAGRFSLARVSTSDLPSATEETTTDLQVEHLKLPHGPLTWRMTPSSEGDAFPVLVGVEDDDEVWDDDVAAASAPGDLTTPQRELSTWDTRALVQSLDPSEAPTLVQPGAQQVRESLPPPVSERRFLDVQSPDVVAPGSIFSVTCAIRLTRGEHGIILQPAEIPYDGATVFVAISADDGLEITSPAWIACTIHPSVDSETIEFRVRVTAPTPQRTRLALTVEIDGHVVGGADLPLRIGGATASPRSWPQTPLLPRRIEDGDALLTIVHDTRRGERRLRFHWDDGRLRSLPDLVISVDAEHGTLLAKVRHEMWLLAHGNPPASVKEQRTRLSALGRRLWSLFLPPEVQTLLLGVGDDVRRLLLLTDGTSIPWEILHPPRPDDEFLLERIPVTRWPSGRSPVSTLGTNIARVAVPLNAPVAATTEAQLVHQIMGRRGTSETVTDFAGLMATVETGQFQVLHFACHDLLNADMLNFGGVPFGVELMADATLTMDPLVFVSAGRTGPVTEESFSRPVTWARTLIDRRAAAYIGSQWDVSSGAATEFAREFYEALVERRVSLGDAALQARRAILGRPGDPSWLAYTVYGDPLARSAS
jgi:hypothetical protein